MPELASALTTYGPLGIFAFLMVLAIVYIVREFRDHMREAINDCKEDRARLITGLREKEAVTQGLVIGAEKTQIATNSAMSKMADALDRNTRVIETYMQDEETREHRRKRSA